MSGDKKVTSVEVAKLAGVSRSAVSRAFTPGASVSASTLEKIQLAAKQLNYRPNTLARSLITGQSRIIGVVVAYLDNLFYPDALEKMSKALQAEGYHVLVFLSSQTIGNIDDVIDEMLDFQVVGMVLFSVALSSDLSARIRAAGVPVVLFNRYQDIDGIAAVTSDNHAGSREVARFLVAGGHKRISYIAGWEGASTQRDREAGFREGLALAGKAIYAREVGDYHTDRAREAARRMFDRPAADRPDAVFVANDHMAVLVMDVIRTEFGLSVPDDVSVVGYDDAPMAAWSAYSLTTVRQRANLMVSKAVEMLLDQFQDATKPAAREVVDAPLILRGSARIPKGWIK